MAVENDYPDIIARLDALMKRSSVLEAEGLPYPRAQVEDGVRQALQTVDLERANLLLKRGEALYLRAARDWSWVKELLRRADELRQIAATIGVDVAHLETRVGNPRQQLRDAPLSAGSLERAAASASLALAVLSDTIPKFCVQEAKKLGVSIKSAKDRGEETTEATQRFQLLIQSLNEGHVPVITDRLLETRRAVGRIPRAPAVASFPTQEEEEILLEARNLARRLHRIKGRARDAQSAARLMAEVRAALSEDRRFGTPEEEIEELWNEVDRLTRERQLDPGTATPTDPVSAAETDESDASPMESRRRTRGARIPAP